MMMRSLQVQGPGFNKLMISAWRWRDALGRVVKGDFARAARTVPAAVIEGERRKGRSEAKTPPKVGKQNQNNIRVGDHGLEQEWSSLLRRQLEDKATAGFWQLRESGVTGSRPLVDRRMQN